MMDDETLLLKYQALLAENKALKEENLSLKAKLGSAASVERQFCSEGFHQDISRTEISRQIHAG